MDREEEEEEKGVRGATNRQHRFSIQQPDTPQGTGTPLVTRIFRPVACIIDA